jgi:site-specific recombinase XerD
MKEHGHAGLGSVEVRQFLAYVSAECPTGRWGNPQVTRKSRPETVKTYDRILRAFFNWLIESELIEKSPLAKLKPPLSRPDQIRPLSPEQVEALLNAAKRSKHPKRDLAVLMVLLDTGLRAGEICSLKAQDHDPRSRCLRTLGKGNKYRSVFYGMETAKALRSYLREEDRGADAPLFKSERGQGMQRNGLLQLIERLGRKAGIEGIRFSPHTLRHTFAVSFLRAGGNVFTLKELLGHTSLHMTNRYVSLASADIEAQAKSFSPLDQRARRSPR